MEKASMSPLNLHEGLTRPKYLHEDPKFKGVRPIDKEQLTPNIVALCDALEAKLLQVYTDNHVVIDITYRTSMYMDIASDAVHFKDYDVQTLHVFYQRRLLETCYPEKEVTFLGAFEEDGKIDELQERFGKEAGRLKFFAAHDGHFGVAAWLIGK